ncbi:DUF3157 domain-containing protein [Shewanella loihica]|uniref:DUF3157 domain-containing protein n=1 Tax=Shewanella loihica (strain ATCC BAA-1088 / PV-4) TaxID=323850 RepID=A3QJH2_SHELP|nr:DUF3157 family protein [Shewanella loihica]ABO25620.1 conserved hypothetical protein [Shewanella loihica PV-4]
MYKALQSCAIMALFLLMAPAFAADKADDAVALITLENGATVRLNADFTWEYVFLTPQANTVTTEPQATTETIQTQTSTEAGQVVAQAPKVQPVVIASGPVVGGAMTASAMDHANLLRSTAKGGAKVSYLKSQWDSKGRLGLNFELSSNSEENYVIIEMEIGLYADSGELIKTETVNVWQAIFRVPETYLRKGQTRDSETFWIEGIDKARWSKELMTLKIIDMSSR